MLYTQTIYNFDFENFDNNDAFLKFKKNLDSVIEYEVFNIAFKKNDLKEIEQFSTFVKNKFKKVLILGIGGSSLGAKTLISIKDSQNVLFSENIDDEKIRKLFNNLDLKNTAILTISKSGKTIECISQTLLLLKAFEDKFRKDKIKDNFFFLTEDKISPLTKLANHFGIKIIAHNKNIGGRFSYLSNVGLIPASIAGLNIAEIREGAKDCINYFLHNKNNFIKEIAEKQDLLYKSGIIGNVIMPYQEKLNHLVEWYRQLWAESLGKNGFGTVPIQALGTVDQHSQLQLYLGGKKNLFFTFFLKKKSEDSLRIEKTYIEDLKYIKNMTFDDIMDIEEKSTIKILNKNKLPIRVINYKSIDERFISQVMMQFIIETILVGIMNNINPFGQPNVELKKKVSETMYNNFNS